MVLYRVRTTWVGADSPSEYYFDTKAGAEMNLMHLSNGKIDKVEVTSESPLNYYDGCTMCDMTYGEFNATVKEV